MKVIILKAIISIGISIAKSFFVTIFFWTNRRTSISSTAPYFLVLSYLASVSLFYNYSFRYNFLFIHSEASTDFLKKVVWIFRSTRTLVFWKKKKAALKGFWKLPSKASMSESFLSTLRSFPKNCSEQLLCKEPVSGSSCKKEFHSTCKANIFINIQNVFKKIG